VVHGRDNPGGVDEFGVSGYTYKNTFVIYDRRTLSLWYPLGGDEWTAISGPRKGEKIPFIEEPGVVPLRVWRERYPQTRVLLGDRSDWPE
jgi:hypothetical protein